jgi:hypothetical protein
MYDMRPLGVWVTALVLITSCFVAAQTPRPPVKPGKIYIGSFGSGDDAEQLKIALGYELGQSGFKVVDFLNQADSWMSGLVVTRVEDGKQTKRVTVFLKDRQGNSLWNQDIGSASAGEHKTSDVIRQRAQQIARELKRVSAHTTGTKKLAPPKLAEH